MHTPLRDMCAEKLPWLSDGGGDDGDGDGGVRELGFAVPEAAAVDGGGDVAELVSGMLAVPGRTQSHTNRSRGLGGTSSVP